MTAILQSMLVYGSLAGLLYWLGLIAAARQRIDLAKGKVTKFFCWEILAALILFALVSGARWNVGVDHLSYLAEYRNAQAYGETIREFEIGFETLTRGIALLGIHYSVYFGLLAFLQLFFVYSALQGQRYILPYVGATAVLGVHYLMWMNGIRQMLVATAFLWSVRFIQERRALAYASVILIASLFHRSALALLLLYFMPRRDLFPNRALTVLAAGAALLIGADPGWISAMDRPISQIVGWLGYESYAENIDQFLEQSGSTAFGPRMISTYLLFIMVVVYSTKAKRQFDRTSFVVFYNLYVAGFILYGLFVNAHHIFLRPITYLTICSLPVVAFTLHHLRSCGRSRIIAFTVTAVLALAYTPLSVVADSGRGGEDFSNYRLFLYHDGD